MVKRVFIIGVIIITVFLILKCERVIGSSIEERPCVRAWGEEMKMVDGNPSAFCGDQILFFSVENDKISSKFKSDSSINFYFPERSFINLAYSFSEEELRDIIDQDFFKLSINESLHSTFIMRAYSAESQTGEELLDLLFTRTEDYIIMENPATGEDMYLNGVHYIKFRGSPLVPVPPLLD